MVFGALLIFVSFSELTGLSRRMRFHGPLAWITGAASGFLGGLVGNQGGIRSGALLGIDLPSQSFVATSTAVGLIVDGVRIPVYLATSGRAVLGIWPTVLLAMAGVIAGTLLGHRVLVHTREERFRPTVAIVLGLLGVAMLLQAVRPK
jgi:uncharacterized membrane protein YfcA